MSRHMHKATRVGDRHVGRTQSAPRRKRGDGVSTAMLTGKQTWGQHPRAKEAVRHTGHAEKDLRNLDALAEAEDLIEFGCQQVTPSVMRAALHECGYLS